VLDWRPQKPIVFDPSVDLEQGVGGHARRILAFLVDEIERDSAVLENPILKASFDEMLLNALLALPNNYSNELVGGPTLSVAPALVRRAEEFMEAHATEPITISDLVEQCGCSRRALFCTFRKFRGYTPNQFLANSRLRAARASLQSPSPSETITSIAFASGFSHLGRFSEAYRRRFGELPSETMHRAGSSIET
jgi:AraC-like DNA-binding protein